jgi:hypothetical protein
LNPLRIVDKEPATGLPKRSTVGARRAVPGLY